MYKIAQRVTSHCIAMSFEIASFLKLLHVNVRRGLVINHSKNYERVSHDGLFFIYLSIESKFAVVSEESILAAVSKK